MLRHYGMEWMEQARQANWTDRREDYVRFMFRELKLVRYEDLYAPSKAMKRQRQDSDDDDSSTRTTTKAKRDDIVDKNDTRSRKKVRFADPIAWQSVKGCFAIHIRTDSMLAEKLANGRWRIRQEDFLPIVKLVRSYWQHWSIMMKVMPATPHANWLKWIPRDQNKKADE